MSLTIITNYGNIDYDDIEFDELPGELTNFLQYLKQIANIFFSNKINLHDFDNKYNLDDFIEYVLIKNKFKDPMRALALAQHTSSDLDLITQEDDITFQENNNLYLVLTDEEADMQALESEINLLKDVGIKGLNESIYEQFIDQDWFDNMMNQNHEEYVRDIQEEEPENDIYINRLHEEMVFRNLMEEPSWPDEDDYVYEREEFLEEEPDKNDFDSENEWKIAYSVWKEKKDNFEKEQDKLEEEYEEKYELAIENYKEALELEIENNIERFIKILNNDYENGIDSWKQNFGEDSFYEIVQEYDLVDYPGLAQEIVDIEGRGLILNHYDGQEYEETVTFQGSTETFYIYQQ